MLTQILGHRNAYIHRCTISLHAWIQGSTAEDVKKAAKKIQDLIDMEIYNPDCEQMVALRAKHMHELAVLNGTLKEFEIKFNQIFTSGIEE